MDYQRDHAIPLVEALGPDAEAAVADIRAALEAIMRATDAYFTVERQATAILGPVQGLDAQDLPRSDRIANLRRFANRELDEALPLPLPRSLVHQPDFPPLKVLAPGGDR
jgi:hypothetical protein